MDFQNYSLRDSFSVAVRNLANTRSISQADFTRLCGLSKTTASRIFRDSNDKGASYAPTVNIVMAVSIGLKLTVHESKELFFSAFPEVEFWECFLSNNLTVMDANEVLFEAGLNQLISTIE